MPLLRIMAGIVEHNDVPGVLVADTFYAKDHIVNVQDESHVASLKHYRWAREVTEEERQQFEKAIAGASEGGDPEGEGGEPEGGTGGDAGSDQTETGGDAGSGANGGQEPAKTKPSKKPGGAPP
ncbi:MAG: hypothetical protein AB7F96_16405 [Beijerinckiaceae bacterium]